MAIKFLEESPGEKSSIRLSLFIIVITGCITILALVALSWIVVLTNKDISALPALIGSFIGLVGVAFTTAFGGKSVQRYIEAKENNLSVDKKILPDIVDKIIPIKKEIQ